ncbi:ATP-binding protein [Sorangium sp. So ce119]|uniref:ATP-binding protein n=1 Tax=Sorangium sp. So ce119 TaxID=3133279 RepID=UPI003F62F044
MTPADLGLRSLTVEEAADVYEVIRLRYQRGAMILTSNRAVEEFGGLFGDPLLASAAMAGSSTTPTSSSSRATRTATLPRAGDAGRRRHRRRARHEHVERMAGSAWPTPSVARPGRDRGADGARDHRIRLADPGAIHEAEL